jgi:hypothetical protein
LTDKELTVRELMSRSTGIFIGEGCIKADGRKNSYRVRISMTNCEYSIIKDCIDEFGGGYCIIPAKMRKDGYFRSKQYMWELSGIDKVRNAINKMLPFMKHVKKQQMILALRLIEIKDKHKHKVIKDKQVLNEMEYLYREIKRLKKARSEPEDEINEGVIPLRSLATVLPVLPAPTCLVSVDTEDLHNLQNKSS